jgi:DNA-binding Xre family transcriptional regulator
MFNIPRRYIPFTLSRKDKVKQKNMILKSRKLYKSKKYFTRKNISSFKSKPSNHITKAKKIYNIDKISPSRELAKKTGCSVQALKKIVNKGEGAYYSSGSRPNQTAQSWGLARLASSITGGKASKVDFKILEEGCSHTGKAYRLAKK